MPTYVESIRDRNFAVPLTRERCEERIKRKAHAYKNELREKLSKGRKSCRSRYFGVFGPEVSKWVGRSQQKPNRYLLRRSMISETNQIPITQSRLMIEKVRTGLNSITTRRDQIIDFLLRHYQMSKRNRPKPHI